MPPSVQDKILFVDDEPHVLQGYQRLLHEDFRVDVAVGAKGALIKIKTSGPYAVVVSDMNMPEMNGVEFLSEVRRISPDTIRVMLTGYAALKTAMDAVNEGNVFRFLTKPCSKEILARTLTASLVQRRLVLAEKELLEKTLKASIRVFTEVLSLVNPAAFSRAMRLRRYMSHVVTRLGLGGPWKFEVAAMMSQLGCVVLDSETIDAAYSGRQLTPSQQARYDAHPEIGGQLLASIPRMEPIAWMIGHQNHPVPVDSDIADREMADMRMGAEMLRITVAFDQQLRKGLSRTEAASKLARQHKDLDPKIFFALVELEPEKYETDVRTCTMDELSEGMFLDQDVITDDGALIAAQGQEITPTLILKLKSFHERNAIDGTVKVTLPRIAEASSTSAGSA